jgi:high-affinity iron transporter
VGLVTWMIFWMARTARRLKTDLQHRLDDAAEAGRRAIVVMARPSTAAPTATTSPLPTA